MRDFRGLRVLIIGAARQGLALARFLSSVGAIVTLNDRLTEPQLETSIRSLSGNNIHWVLGGHPLNLLDSTDLVCISGGVPLSLPLIQEAIFRQLPLTNDTEIFMQSVKARVVGITGSAGKTTTTTLVGRMAEAQKDHKVWVGGNIGRPLVEYLEDIKPEDLVILEISSFQLEQMTLSPHIAVVLNITPNHLDRHGTMSEYIRAKSRILEFQNSSDFAVLNRENEESWKLHKQVKGSLVSFGRNRLPTGETGVFIEENQIKLSKDGRITPLLDMSAISLRGEHNILNVVAACSIASTMGLTTDAMLNGVLGFTGVQHRLEVVREHRGVTWINDSIATTPERTTADILSFTDPLILLLGGRDKNLPWNQLSALVHQRVDHVVIFGEAGDKIAAALGNPKENDRLNSIRQFSTLQQALEESNRIAKPGDIVLLSPGCTSYDAFRDFEERGEFFRKWVNELS